MQPYIDFVWDEGTANILTSFKSGDPKDTFYNHLNARFDHDPDFQRFLLYLFGRVAALGAQESERMREMEALCVGKQSNLGLAFVKTFKFYGRSKAYEQLHKLTPLQDLA